MRGRHSDACVCAPRVASRVTRPAPLQSVFIAHGALELRHCTAGCQPWVPGGTPAIGATLGVIRPGTALCATPRDRAVEVLPAPAGVLPRPPYLRALPRPLAPVVHACLVMVWVGGLNRVQVMSAWAYVYIHTDARMGAACVVVGDLLIDTAHGLHRRMGDRLC